MAYSFDKPGRDLVFSHEAVVADLSVIFRNVVDIFFDCESTLVHTIEFFVLFLNKNTSTSLLLMYWLIISSSIISSY